MFEKHRQKALEAKMEQNQSKFNQIKKPTNVLFNIILSILSLLSVIPFIFVIIISFTDENTLAMNGYRFIPEKFSLYAYQYIVSAGENIIRSYGVTILVTVLGTLLGLLLTGTYAYALSRKTYAFKKFFTTMITIPMLFSGGMIANYLIVTKVLMLKDTIWALILPLCLNSFNIIVLRTFFKTSIPDAVVESAKIDGASEWRLFFQIVIPMALPGLATIGLFLTLGYWNDWFNAMMYMDSKKWVPLQYLLIQIESSMDWLASNKSMMGVDGIQAAANLPKETIKMAIVVISTLPIIFAYPFFQRYFVNGLTVGAVKE
ncbi:carbohydrate ABC transporter permease [Faecalicatena sp. AGMB00832]|uniref:Carbohydrate ABC transporter permease n=1 Tax=Faecalicatena faecalis TaxID=2726362 RepID=A0ABS6D998_9FIRM|nr:MULTISPECIES: carbohydrate ABC transporter permease [Faecalicatena]MBU3878031.1 carbohydrate ABC transporter permease [Faecalicatena faecalis]MCI6467693.1 carbohydrate ABC transporter permease [Faecalicatena sp.]MDY5616944.1 carbohydrate ABC transporter permease [Lachnospiraceae bacterium]